MVNYLSKFLQMMVGVCEPLRRLTSVSVAFTWNRSYQEIYERAKSLVKEEKCTKYYNIRKPLYLETDAWGLGLGATLLQARDDLNCGYDEVLGNTMLWPIAFTSKSLSNTEWLYNNIEKEAPRILHGLEKFNHYCFTHEVLVITDNKPLGAIMGKDMATLLQCLQCIILCIHL